MRSDDLYRLPPNLPAPVDDGAADHLLGAEVPDIALMATSGHSVSVAELSTRRRVVLYCYPRTGRPDQDPPKGWDDVPGARGCTPQSCGFRDHYGEIQALGAEVFGVSLQDTDYQREMAARIHLPFGVLSDMHLELTNAMRLPTFSIIGHTLLKRTTLVLRHRRVEKVFYPVFPPDLNAVELIAWLQSVA